MSTTLTSSPPYPVEGASVTLAVEGSFNDAFVLELVTVPATSALTLGFLVSSAVDTAAAAALDTAQKVLDANAAAFEFVPDVGGNYDFVVWEFRQPNGAASGYVGDPIGDARNELRITVTATISVAPTVTMPIFAVSGDGATLVITTNGDIIRTAALVAITERARWAAAQPAVVAALEALVGADADMIGEDLVIAANDLRVSLIEHLARTACHVVADTVNTIAEPPAASQLDAVRLVNHLRLRVEGHFRGGTGVGGVIEWHVVDEWDTKNLPVAATAYDVAGATVLLADLRERCYERHRLHATGESSPFDDPEVHTETDGVNTLTAPTLLDAVIVAFLDEMVDMTPAALANEPSGAHVLTNRHGFVRD